MTEQFYTILTNIGKASIANASALGSKVDFQFIALGDGNGGYYSPTEVQTELKKEVWRGQVSHVTVGEDNPNWVEVSAIVPAMVGGFSIREIGIFDTEGDMLAIGKYPETYKPTAEDGSTKDLVIRMILEVSNASVVTLKIDPTVILVTKKDLEDLKDSIDKEIGNIGFPVTTVNEKKGDVVLTAEDIKDDDGKTVEERLADISTEVENIEFPVKSVNDKTGAVTLTPSDVGAAPTDHGHAYSEITGKPNTFPPSGHTHTPEQVGLKNVLNYGVATVAEAQAGVVGNKYMTPALVKAAIERLGLTMRVFTDNGTFVVPDGVYGLYVTACGAGGKGGNGGNGKAPVFPGGAGGGGGGGACVIHNFYKVTPGQIINIVVGKKTNGAGGLTSLSGLVSLPGGEAGENGSAATSSESGRHGKGGGGGGVGSSPGFTPTVGGLPSGAGSEGFGASYGSGGANAHLNIVSQARGPHIGLYSYGGNGTPSVINTTNNSSDKNGAHGGSGGLGGGGGGGGGGTGNYDSPAGVGGTGGMGGDGIVIIEW